MNSRMKDFWDIQLLSHQFDFDGKTLATAIEKTFSTRHTAIPIHPIAFTETFMKDEIKIYNGRPFSARTGWLMERILLR